MTALVLALALAVPDLRVVPSPVSFAFSAGDVVSERNTKIALAGAALGLLVYEVAILRERADGHVTPTISQVMRDAGARYGTTEWIAGNLMGHWWLNAEDGLHDRDRARSTAILLSLTALVVAWDVVDHSGRNRWRGPLLLGAGIASGRFLWTQGYGR